MITFSPIKFFFSLVLWIMCPCGINYCETSNEGNIKNRKHNQIKNQGPVRVLLDVLLL